MKEVDDTPLLNSNLIALGFVKCPCCHYIVNVTLTEVE